MKPKGCSILFLNSRKEILLVLRDDMRNIPYPNMWDIPGGYVEANETPEQCIVREIKEEMGLNINEHQLFSVTEFTDRTEYTFWIEADLDINKIHLTEGQCLRWFSHDDVRITKFAYGFNQVIDDFYKKKPFLQST